MILEYSTNQSSHFDILKHLKNCDDNFLAKLNSTVDINAYAEKLLKNAYLFEAWNDNDLIGLVAAYPGDINVREAYITNVSVLRSHQRQGIASRLLGQCRQYFLSHQYKSITLDVYKVNKKAMSSYINFGFYLISDNNEKFKMKLDI